MKTDMALPDNHRIDEEKYRSLLKYIRLSVTEKYDFPQEIVQIDGVTIATLGNFSASTGKPKSKKTFNVSAIVASALSGKEVLKYKAELPPCKNRVLYIDTEQSKCHCHKVLHRILTLRPADRPRKRPDRIFRPPRIYSRPTSGPLSGGRFTRKRTSDWLSSTVSAT